MKMRSMRESGRRKGAISLSVVVALPILVAGAAFAVDLSILQIQRERVQRVADAGAVAGGLELDSNDPGIAKKVAEAYVRDQGNQGSGAISATPVATCDVNLQHLDISVDQKVPTYFLRFFGIKSETAHASAAVETDDRVSGAGGTVGPSKLGIFAPIALKSVANMSLGSGNLGATYWMVDYSGTPSGRAGLSADLRGFAEGGFAGPIKVGDVLKIHGNRNERSLLIDGIKNRLQNPGSSQWVNTATPKWYRLQDPAVVVVPVVRDLNSESVKVVRFAAVRLVTDGNSLSVNVAKVIVPRADFDLTAKKGDPVKYPNASVFGVRLVK
jgi:hypothetical protein